MERSSLIVFLVVFAICLSAVDMSRGKKNNNKNKKKCRTYLPCDCNTTPDNTTAPTESTTPDNTTVLTESTMVDNSTDSSTVTPESTTIAPDLNTVNSQNEDSSEESNEDSSEEVNEDGSLTRNQPQHRRRHCQPPPVCNCTSTSSTSN